MTFLKHTFVSKPSVFFRTHSSTRNLKYIEEFGDISFQYYVSVSVHPCCNWVSSTLKYSVKSTDVWIKIV